MPDEQATIKNAPTPTEAQRAYIDKVCNEYQAYINDNMGLLSMLYDVDLLPEQLQHVLEVNPAAAGPNSQRMIAICELWKRQATPAELSARATPTFGASNE